MSGAPARRSAACMSATGTLVRLRALTSDDASNWLQWINDPDVMDGLDRAVPVTADQHAEYIRKNVVQNDTAVWYAIEEAVKGRHIGVVWLWDIHWRHRRAEVRIVIAPSHAGQGYGKASLQQVARYAFNTLGLHKLYAYVH
jgi:diamine N-acetyltransferase